VDRAVSVAESAILGRLDLREPPTSVSVPDRIEADEGSAAEALRLVLALTTALSARPTDMRVLHSVMMNFPPRFDVIAGLLARRRDDGSYLVTSQVGFPQSRRFVEPIRIDHEWLVGRALRGSDPIVMTGPAEIDREFLLTSRCYDINRVVSAVPLTATGASVGRLVLSLGSSSRKDLTVSGLLQSLGSLLGLYVHLTHDEPGADTEVVQPTLHRRAGHTPPALSARQLTIVRLVASGLSNPSIAMRIGFSESTVRQENIKIFRAFGLHTRAAVVDSARIYGLVP